MKVGDKMECALLDTAGSPTGEYTNVEIRQIGRDHVTQNVVNARVRFRLRGANRDRWLWVQASLLRGARKKAA